MIKGFKKIEIAAAFGIVISLLFGAIAAAQGTAQARSVSEKLVRLHIIANSDRKEDQDLKLKVRDALLPMAAEITKTAQDKQTAQMLLKNSSELMRKRAEEELCKNGCGDSVELSFEKCYFPTKKYNDFSLPAGEYDAVRVIIGQGKGKNWWCVMFPPLCVPEAEGQAEVFAEIGGLDKGEIAFISDDGEQYKIKFKAAEICAEIYHKIKSISTSK